MDDSVAQAVLATFAALPKKAKPQPHEHTVLAGIALSLPADSSNSNGSGVSLPAAEQQEQQQQRLAVAAIGTGTKCLGASQRAPDGGAVNDCHGEVLCRRALLRWLYGEMQQVVERYSLAIQQAGRQPDAAAAAEAAAQAGTPVLRLVLPGEASSNGGSAGGEAPADELGSWRFELQRGVQLHLYISQPPCGDAAILASPPPSQHSHAAAQQCLPPSTSTNHQDCNLAGSATAGSAAWTGVGFGRTGAKRLRGAAILPPEQQLAAASTPGHAAVLQQQQQQWHLPQQWDVEGYAEGQAVGVVRRKPGRGDATLSMSCSDKLARWCLQGLQGSLLGAWLTAPLHLASITVGLPPARSCDLPLPASGTPYSLAPVAGMAAGSASEGEDVAGGTAEVSGTASGDLAAAAEAALRRALLDRTAELAAQRLPAGFYQAAPQLHIHLPGAKAAVTAGSDSGGGCQALDLALDLAPSATRTSAGGASLVWVAPPSPEFQWKQKGPALVATLVGGSSEGITGSSGLKAGSGKVGAGHAVPAARQCSVCKAALFRQWQALAAAVASLPLLPTQRPQEEQLPPKHSVRVCSYRAAKQAACPSYREAWQRLRQPPSPLAGWIPKPAALEDFVLPA